MSGRGAAAAPPAVDPADLAWLDREQMVEVDRVMIEELHIELIQMMEHAGTLLARLATDLFGPAGATVYAGPGGNGGGGLVAARHLTNLGVAVTVVLARAPDELAGVTAHQLDIVERMGIDIVDQPSSDGVAIDALIGYSLRGAPTGRAADLIEATAQHRRVISLDVPSGLDVTTGEMPGAGVRADATLTLAAPKRGLRAHPAVGRLFVGDISVPSYALAATGADGPAPPFTLGPILEVTPTTGR